ncbi:MAG TPA: hypothetical protein VNO43_10270 [Candidatus Eisenbacteria bacterium]|nr:hypothetical protein [Candidatus Eisenbacteria bacterium]
MPEKIEIGLRDGTLVRHKQQGYEGRIAGTTAIKACFTRGGVSLNTPVTKEAFQYRIFVSGESMPHVAPVDDLEILDASAEISCVRCEEVFRTKPGSAGKAGGRCACGGWICPVCLGCQSEEASKDKATSCAHQRKRLMKKLTRDKRAARP